MATSAPTDSRYNPSHLAIMRQRLIEQYKNKPNFDALLVALSSEIQTLEDVFNDLRWLRTLSYATGIQLDRLGYLVGVKRGALADASYRARIFAQGMLNVASGSPEEIYSILAAMLATTPSATVQLVEYFPAAFVVRVGGVTIANASDLAAVMRLAKDCGVQFGAVEYNTDTDANSFVLEPICDFLAGGVGATATAIVVANAARFLVGQSVIIEAGSGVAETRTITAINTSTNTLTIAALTNAHSANATVQLATSSGLGFGDTSNGATGGALAGATT